MVYNPDWVRESLLLHPLVEKFYRPVVVFDSTNGLLTGSGID